MKSFEELEIMTVPQLKGIAESLAVNVPANISKAKLVQLVYDVQQPAPDEDKTDPAPDPVKELTIAEEFEAKKQEIADFFEGEIVDTEDEIEGEQVFAVFDPLADAEIVRGTFAELYAEVKGAESEAANGTAGIDQSKPGDTGFQEIELSDPAAVQNHTTPKIQSDSDVAEIEEALKVLQALGLRYKIEGSVIQFTKGPKVVSTTLNQPKHRVIRTAEQLCNFR